MGSRVLMPRFIPTTFFYTSEPFMIIMNQTEKQGRNETESKTETETEHEKKKEIKLREEIKKKTRETKQRIRNNLKQELS